MPLSLLLLASGSYEPPGLLAGLVDAKRREIDRMKLLPDAREDGPWSLRLAYPALTYSSALTDHLSDLTMPAVLADLKRSSPGPKLGEVEWVDQELAVAAALQRAIGLGAAGALISTDTTTYGGSHADLSAARQHLEAFSDAGLESPSMPIIAKDFILDPLQISRAVCQGADAVLIVVAAAAAELPALLDTCTLLGVEALVEVHTVRELQIALECGASLFLVNERDRATARIVKGQVYAIPPPPPPTRASPLLPPAPAPPPTLHPSQSPIQTLALAAALPPDCIGIACGGISSAEEVGALWDSGFVGVAIGRGLVGASGTQLMREIQETLQTPKGRPPWTVVTATVHVEEEEEASGNGFPEADEAKPGI